MNIRLMTIIAKEDVSILIDTKTPLIELMSEILNVEEYKYKGIVKGEYYIFER